MKKLFLFVGWFLLVPHVSSAEEVFSELSFEALSHQNDIHAGKLTDDNSILQVTGTSSSALIKLITIPSPGVQKASYALRGDIRVRDIAGIGFLQLNSDFGDRGLFFTRALADSGPMQKLSGTSEWRRFVLPFNASNGESFLTPTSLELLVQLPEGGTIELRKMELVQFAPNESPMASILPSTGEWWSSKISSSVGTAFGVLFGLWGALTGYLASRQRGQGFIILSSGIFCAFGAATLVAGGVALMHAQPMHITYLLLLLGTLLFFLCGGIRLRTQRQVQQEELRKIEAVDSAG